MAFASDIPPEKRSLFLERIAAMLAIRGPGHFGDNGRRRRSNLGQCERVLAR
jgi:hypothetical protein